MAKMNPVVHFEMPAKDKKRVSEFYAKAFGWEMMQMGEDFGGYLLATTTPTDAKTGRPKEPGAINGGFWQTDKDNEPPHVVISVENLEEAMKKVEEADGKIIGGATGVGKIDDIPGVGRYISIEDSEGNRVGLLQPVSAS